MSTANENGKYNGTAKHLTQGANISIIAKRKKKGGSLIKVVGQYHH